jgi:hypothetical protein
MLLRCQGELVENAKPVVDWVALQRECCWCVGREVEYPNRAVLLSSRTYDQKLQSVLYRVLLL